MRREMRTPLNAVIGYAELCLDEARENNHAELVKDLEKILRAAKNLLSLFESEDYPDQIEIGDPTGDLGIAGEATLGVMTPPALSAAAVDFGISAPQMPNARLLAVDDDDMNREMLVRRLQKIG
jgi:signal transduction histidine kinase